MQPITELTRKTRELQWGLLQQEAFDKLKHLITSQPVSQVFYAEKYTKLHAHASAVGIAGMLFQQDAQEHMKLVYCVSKKNSETDGHYHSSKLELMADYSDNYNSNSNINIQ